MSQREIEQPSWFAKTASGPDSRRHGQLTLLTEPSDGCNSNVKHVSGVKRNIGERARIRMQSDSGTYLCQAAFYT